MRNFTRESWEECARREVLEEAGLDLLNISFVTAVNAVEMENDYHYITIFMVGETTCPQNLENLEPDKCYGRTRCLLSMIAVDRSAHTVPECVFNIIKT